MNEYVQGLDNCSDLVEEHRFNCITHMHAAEQTRTVTYHSINPTMDVHPLYRDQQMTIYPSTASGTEHHPTDSESRQDDGRGPQMIGCCVNVVKEYYLKNMCWWHAT